MKKNNLLFLKTRKHTVDQYLEKVITEQKKIYTHHLQTQSFFEYLSQFVKAGKTIRGVLFLETLSLLGKTEDEIREFIPLAAAMEIIHSALLIQDDYMDQDDQRRGSKALHKTIEDNAKDNTIKNPPLYAVSAMICATDICFFIAFSEIAKIKIKNQSEIISFLSKEYVNVGFAQWKDVELGLSTSDANLEELKSVYLYKTARYTFVMPILLASIICNVDTKLQQHLNAVAESLGMIFQITDDYLSLFGDPQLTGKPLGSDIIQDKQTIYKYYLTQLQRQKKSSSASVLSLFGKNNLTKNDIQTIQNEIKNNAINTKVDNIVNTYRHSFNVNLKKINNDALTAMLKALFNHIENRQK